MANCLYCGKPMPPSRSYGSEKRYCNRSCGNAAYRERHFIRKPKGNPVIPVKPWSGPRCFCGAPGRYEGKCGHHNMQRRYQIRKRNALIREFIGSAEMEVIKLAILNFGSLNTLVGYVHD